KVTLNRLAFQLVTAHSPSQAIGIFSEQNYEIILIDVDVIDVDVKNKNASAPPVRSNSQYTSVDDLCSAAIAVDLPVILLGSNVPEQHNLETYYKTGHVAFVTKPIMPRVLLLEMYNLITLQQVNIKYQKLADEGTLIKLELSRRNEQLAISSQVARQINSILDPDQLVNEIVQIIQRQFRCFVGIWLIAPQSSFIELKASSYENETNTIEPDSKLSLANAISIITHVCSSQTMYLTQNISKDPYYSPSEALPSTQAELAIPLLAAGSLLGVIDIECNRPDVFHPDDVEMLCTLADQTAIAIRNASLYNEVLQASAELENKIQARTRELQETYQKLELLEQNKTDFIQVLSHELRTPLTLVSGYSELLLTHDVVKTDPLFSQQVFGVLTGARRLHELIDSMVDLLKIDSRSLQLMPQRITIEEILTPLTALLADSLQKRQLTLSMDTIDSLPEIEGDLDLLGKVFDQLLSNAIKYTPDGGFINIQGRHLNQEFDGVVEEFVEISIRDTGIGISAKLLDVIFTKFYRTGDVSKHSSGKIKFKGGGPGLGLSIARGIGEAHRGRVWAESPGHDELACPGSCFYVLLPVTQKM
ncbi:MAG: sensor histidine kinase, partial [Anaerolineales bacterium]